MTQADGRRLMEMLLDDAEMRTAYRRDPHGTARRAGLTLDDDTQAALESFDWSGNNAQLRQRLSKQSCGAGCGQ